jgi:hypothetical protein
MLNTVPVPLFWTQVFVAISGLLPALIKYLARPGGADTQVGIRALRTPPMPFNLWKIYL